MITEQGRILESLLSGQFICQISDEDGWRFLKSGGNSDKIETHLNLLNRTLASAADGDVFYAAYQSLGDNERKVLSSQFQEVSSHLLPMVEWLLLVQQASGNDVPISQGSAIRLTELQATIEDTPAFLEQLAKLSHYRLFGSTSGSVDGQLKQVFKRLTDLGYVIKPNQEKQIFIATGKIEYLFDIISGKSKTEKRVSIKSSNDAYREISGVLSDLTHEEFWVIYLNKKNEVIKKENISKGGVDGTVADTKIIFKHAIEQLASAIILFHNHPSGNLKPSNADIKLTKKIKETGIMLDTPVLDHLIIGEKDYFSFADEGII